MRKRKLRKRFQRRTREVVLAGLVLDEGPIEEGAEDRESLGGLVELAVDDHELVLSMDTPSRRDACAVHAARQHHNQHRHQQPTVHCPAQSHHSDTRVTDSEGEEKGAAVHLYAQHTRNDLIGWRWDAQ